MASNVPRLNEFGPLWRLGIGLLILTLVGGYVVSGIYLKQHYENRDQRPGLTLTDIQGAYAGVVTPSPLLSALERGHPEDMNEADRDALLAWLRSDTIERDYENFDLGDAMPADIILVSCVDCHARGATGENAYPQIPLEYEDDVLSLAISNEIRPKDPAIIIQSLHAHAPSMATCTIVLAVLAGMTRWWRPLVGLVVSVSAIGLIADLAGQYLARVHDPMWTYAIVGGGFASSAGVGLLGLLALADAWLPGGKRAED